MKTLHLERNGWLLLFFFTLSAGHSSDAFAFDKYFTIQASSCSTAVNAQKQLKKIKSTLGKKISDIKIEKSDRSFKVRIGNFTTKTKAAQQLKLIETIVPGAFIVSVKTTRPPPKPFASVTPGVLHPTAGLVTYLKEINLAADQGNYQHALDLIETAMQKWPKRHELSGWYGSVLLKQNKFGRALLYFKDAGMLSPGIADYHNGEGYCLLSLDEPSRAAGAFQKALDINDHFADSLAGIGYAYLTMGEKEKATGIYQRLKTIDEKSARALLKQITRE